MMREWLLRLPRRYKRLLQVTVDVMLVWIALWLAFVVRLGTDELVHPLGGHAWLFAVAPVLAIPLYVKFGMYRAVMRYFGNDALVTITKVPRASSGTTNGSLAGFSR